MGPPGAESLRITGAVAPGGRFAAHVHVVTRSALDTDQPDGGESTIGINAMVPPGGGSVSSPQGGGWKRSSRRRRDLRRARERLFREGETAATAPTCSVPLQADTAGLRSGHDANGAPYDADGAPHGAHGADGAPQPMMNPPTPQMMPYYMGPMYGPPAPYPPGPPMVHQATSPGPSPASLRYVVRAGGVRGRVVTGGGLGRYGRGAPGGRAHSQPPGSGAQGPFCRHCGLG